MNKNEVFYNNILQFIWMWYTYGFASAAVSSVKDRTSTMISFCDSISIVEILQIILIVKQIVLLLL